MNKFGPSLALAMALTTSPLSAVDKPKEFINTAKQQTTEVMSTQKTLNQGGINASLILGVLFLGSGLASYLNRDSQKKDAKIAEHVFRMLGEKEI